MIDDHELSHFYSLNLHFPPGISHGISPETDSSDNMNEFVFFMGFWYTEHDWTVI